MFTIQLTINALFLGGLLIAALVIGYLFRSAQLNSLKRKLNELQQELLSNHADILELQQEKTAFEQKLKEYSSSPVIPITVSTDEKNAEKLQDVSMRKKLFTKKSAE
jgi:hypothetical protein